MTPPQASNPNDQDGETRNREAVRTLLKLRDESLMSAVAKGSKITGVKLDYGNASAWVREIPGRFGQAKQIELLRYLGIEGHRLNPRQIHFWALPQQSDAEQSEGLLNLLKTHADQPDRFMWLTSPTGAFRGLAIRAGGVSIVFLPTAKTNQAEMARWVAQLKGMNEQDASAEAGIKTEEIWRKLISNQLPPEALWSASVPTPEQDWQVVIELAEKNDLNPASTQTLLRAALLLLQEGESATAFLDRIIAKKITGVSL